MDNLEKAQQMARIKLMLEIQSKRKSQTKQKLFGMALKLIQEGKSNQEIISVLTDSESLSRHEVKVLEEILSAVG